MTHYSISETTTDVLEGKAYQNQLTASDLRINKIPDGIILYCTVSYFLFPCTELLPSVAPLIQASSSTSPQSALSMDATFSVYAASLNTLGCTLPSQSAQLPIRSAAPKLSQWAKENTQQLATIEVGAIFNKINDTNV